jgi:hypothetical protein
MDAAATRTPGGADATTLATAESLELLRTEQVGRVCIDIDGYPVAFAVNYIVDETPAGPGIVIRTPPASMIGEYRGRASLEVDHCDLTSGRTWSVIVRGELTASLGDGTGALPRPFVSEDRSRRMELTIASMTGRAFTVERSGFMVDWQLAP